EIRAGEGTNVPVGAVLGIIADGAAGSARSAAITAGAAPHPGPLPMIPGSSPGRERERGGAVVQSVPSPRSRGEGQGEGQLALGRSGPAVRKLIAESGLDAAQIAPTGRGGRITKTDFIAARAQSAPSPVSEPRAQPTPVPPREQPGPQPPPATVPPTERETRVRMTRLRRRIAERLKEAQQNAAMLTTFNEIDMSGAIALRERWREAFEKKHGVRLGFMSIFVKAAIVALKELPAVNAEIDGEDLIYKNHYD